MQRFTENKQSGKKSKYQNWLCGLFKRSITVKNFLNPLSRVKKTPCSYRKQKYVKEMQANVDS